jgi:adenylate cyclase
MKTETERKFLIRKDLWYALKKPEGLLLRQGYLYISPEKTIRIRVTPDAAFLTIKGPSDFASRSESELLLPREEAVGAMETFCGRIIEKIRYRIMFSEKLWEVDEFLGEDDGLIMAEIELQNVDEPFELPSWLGEEVTGDPRYYNAYLEEHPYSYWK